MCVIIHEWISYPEKKKPDVPEEGHIPSSVPTPVYVAGRQCRDGLVYTSQGVNMVLGLTPLNPANYS